MGLNTLQGTTMLQQASWDMVAINLGRPKEKPSFPPALSIPFEKKQQNFISTKHLTLLPEHFPASKAPAAASASVSPAAAFPSAQPALSQLLEGSDGRAKARKESGSSLPLCFLHFSRLTGANAEEKHFPASFPLRARFRCAMPKSLACKQNLQKGLIYYKATL